MLDTVRMFTGEFELRGKNNFTRQTTMSPEGEITGEKVFCNFTRPRFSVDIMQYPRRVLTFETSLPKLVYGTSLYEVQPTDLERVVDLVEEKLTEAGVGFEKNQLADFRLSRVDFCRNLTVTHHPTDYLVYLSNRFMPKRQRRDIERETLSFRNGERELTMYNKVKEVRETETDKNILRLVQNHPENILRVESRLKRARVIPKVVGVATPRLSNIFDLRLSRSHLLHEVDSLLVGADSQPEFDFYGNLEVLREIGRERKRGVFDEYLRRVGTREFLSQFGYDWGKVREFLECYYRRRQVYYILAELKKRQSFLVESEERELLREIREKLVA